MPSSVGIISSGNYVYPVVTGGTLTSDTTYYYRTFTANGTLAVTNNLITMDIFAIGGGGGGAAGQYTYNRGSYIWYGLAGGAGGAAQIFTAQTLLADSYHNIVIGAGAFYTNSNQAPSGNETTITSLSVFASGGGGGQYNLGGSNVNYTANGNGGGAGAGGSATSNVGGIGVSGFTGTYGVGGNKGNDYRNQYFGGIGGNPGGQNTGGGGGGGSGDQYGYGFGGSGGSGIVVVRYLRSAVVG